MYYPKSPFLPDSNVESQILKWNRLLLEELIPWLCIPPSITTYRVNLLQTTTATYKSRIQRLLAEKYTEPPEVYCLPDIPDVVCIGPASIAQLPPSLDTNQKQVVVDDCCGAALLRGAHIYAPGVLAMETGTKLGEQVQVYADLSGQCKKGTCARYNGPRKAFLGLGVVRMQRHQLYSPSQEKQQRELPLGIAVEMVANCSNVPCLGDLSDRDALLQNLPSIVCVRVLGAQPGECVLDMCAAPGNKTTHIAEIMHDEGTLLALDKTERKIQHIQDKIQQYQLKCIRACAFDATKAFDPQLKNTKNTDIEGPPFTSKTFDRILLDAPCSALGNRPLLTSSMTPKMLQSFPRVQRRLFDAAVPLLRPKGVLVYSTCTITEEENENMVVWVLQKFPELDLVDATPRLGGPGLRVEGLSEQQRHFVQRFGPSASNTDKSIDTIGFFIAKFVKK